MSQVLHSLKFVGRLSSANGLKLVPAAVISSVDRVAQLHSVKLEGQPEKLYEPWDYVKRPYRFYHQLWEHTTKRMNENSKIVVVEGNIGTDKKGLAKKIAEEFGLLFLPDVKEEDFFVNKNGFDQRELNPRLGKDRFFDLKDLYTAKNPKDALGYGRTQIEMFRLRFFNYILALRHVLNTGQGVVLERSLWSDKCFADAMAKNGYFTRAGKTYYNKVFNQPSQMVWMPHMVVYIDANVSQCQELIAKRNNSLEKNSPLLTDSYLQAIEDSYKNSVLPQFQTYGEVLHFDTDEVENKFDVVAYEMQKVNLEPPVIMDPQKFDDWYEDKEWKWNFLRQKTATDQYYERRYFLDMEAPFTAPEICIQDHNNYDLVVNEHPTNRWAKGYDPETNNVLLKTKTEPYFVKTLP